MKQDKNIEDVMAKSIINLLNEISKLKNPKFKKEKLAVKLANDILKLYDVLLTSKKINRHITREIKRIWKFGLPYNLFELINLKPVLEAEHIEQIMTLK